MTEPETQDQTSPRDRLISRPPDPLPTPLDPAGPESRGHPADPKPGPEDSPGNPAGKNRQVGDLGRAT
jgi:hypothetical protein